MCSRSSEIHARCLEGRRRAAYQACSCFEPTLTWLCSRSYTRGITHVNLASESEPHLPLTATAFTKITRLRQAEGPTHGPQGKDWKEQELQFPCENLVSLPALPAWSPETSGAASRPCARCLWRSGSKSLLQQQDERHYSLPQAGPLRETIHRQVKTFETYMYLMYHAFIRNKPMSASAVNKKKTGWYPKRNKNTTNGSGQGAEIGLLIKWRWKKRYSGTGKGWWILEHSLLLDAI